MNKLTRQDAAWSSQQSPVLASLKLAHASICVDRLNHRLPSSLCTGRMKGAEHVAESAPC